MQNLETSDLKHILIISGDLVESQVLSRFFVTQGWQTEVAASSWEAKEAINKKEYQVVLTDLFIKGMPGSDFIQWARNKNKNSKVIVYSEAKEDESVQKSMQAGAFEHISKPSNIDQLYAKINRSLIEDIL